MPSVESKISTSKITGESLCTTNYKFAFSKSSIRLSGNTLCPRYFFEAHAACLPVNPFEYASRNRRERVANLYRKLMSESEPQRNRYGNYRRIVIRGIKSNAARTLLSRSASFDDAGNWRYRRFAYPQHCSIKLSSQWNLGRKRI